MAEDKPKFERKKPEEPKIQAEPKVEPVKPAPPAPKAPAFDAKAKAEKIKNSKLPESQKQKYLLELGLGDSGEEKEKRVPFSVFAKIKKVPATMHKAMLLFPKAVGVKLASMKQWEEIFKDF